jgi:outer membrane receptor protein involved in Fe transport
MFSISLNFYRNDLENLISTRTVQSGDAGTATIFGYVNISRARTQGFESLVAVRPIEGMTASAGYTLLDAVDLERNRRLDGRAVHRVNFSFAYTYAKWGLGGMVRGSVVTDRVFFFDVNGNELTTPLRSPTYLSLDARLQKRFGRFFDIFVGMDNIAGAGQPLLLPLQPRTVYAGVTGRY